MLSKFLKWSVKNLKSIVDTLNYKKEKEKKNGTQKSETLLVKDARRG